MITWHINPKLYTMCPWTFNTLVDGTNYCNVFYPSQEIMKVAFWMLKLLQALNQWMHILRSMGWSHHTYEK